VATTVPEGIHRRIRALARAQGVSQAEAVRILLARGLEL
jgi:hypothetical protein